jgi:2,4-dienoyl-CoA reductase-like NADH-dependent reductase (Old Yellow Enzyme family)
MNLFDPIRIGAIQAPNRIFMAPLTRGRADRDGVPGALMVEHYTQRASAGLIISEATGISRAGLGWPYAPGLWSARQVEGWRAVTASVHRAGGRMFAQLWHMGRIVHPSYNEGRAPVSASATTAPGNARTYEGLKPFARARPLDVGEIPALLEDYKHAAENAMAAGFDGVELHAANGYLLDQFLRDGANHRTDDYGGSPENRVRLLREVLEALVSVVPHERVAVRLSPNGMSNGVDDGDPHTLFRVVGKVLNQFDLAFLEMREPPVDSTRDKPSAPAVAPTIRSVFHGPLVLNSDFDGPRAQLALASGKADAISFGRTFLANPDLPARLATNAKLNTANLATYYTRGPEGYTDYPTLP